MYLMSKLINIYTLFVAIVVFTLLFIKLFSHLPVIIEWYSLWINSYVNIYGISMAWYIAMILSKGGGQMLALSQKTEFGLGLLFSLPLIHIFLWCKHYWTPKFPQITEHDGVQYALNYNHLNMSTTLESFTFGSVSMLSDSLYIFQWSDFDFVKAFLSIFCFFFEVFVLPCLNLWQFFCKHKAYLRWNNYYF